MASTRYRQTDGQKINWQRQFYSPLFQKGGGQKVSSQWGTWWYLWVWRLTFIISVPCQIPLILDIFRRLKNNFMYIPKWIDSLCAEPQYRICHRIIMNWFVYRNMWTCVCIFNKYILTEPGCSLKLTHTGVEINSIRAKFFRGNINIYLYFMSLLHIDMTQLLKILPHVRPGPTYST